MCKKDSKMTKVLLLYLDSCEWFQVNEARKRKNRRLKQAKEEAQAEIEKYKQEREIAFRY